MCTHSIKVTRSPLWLRSDASHLLCCCFCAVQYVAVLHSSATLLFRKGLCPPIVWHPAELFQHISYFSFSFKWTFLVMFLRNLSLSPHSPRSVEILCGAQWLLFEGQMSSLSKVAAQKLFCAIIYLNHFTINLYGAPACTVTSEGFGYIGWLQCEDHFWLAASFILYLGEHSIQSIANSSIAQGSGETFSCLLSLPSAAFFFLNLSTCAPCPALMSMFIVDFVWPCAKMETIPLTYLSTYVWF